MYLGAWRSPRYITEPQPKYARPQLWFYTSDPNNLEHNFFVLSQTTV
jgi:hypothetical protein